MLYASALLITACTSAPQKVEDEKKLNKIDPYLNSLVKKFPNYLSNDLIRIKAEKALSNDLDSLVKNNYFDDIPLKILTISKNPHGKGSLVQFHVDQVVRPDRLSDAATFDVIGLMEDSLAETLNDKATYKIKGSYKAALDQTQVSVLVNQTYYSPDLLFSKNSFDDNQFNLGVFLCEVKSVELISSP